jgi:hypothetical protein
MGSQNASILNITLFFLLLGEVLNAHGRINVYGLALRRRPLMKATRRDRVLSRCERVSRESSVPGGSEESLFSFLLKVESQLRAGIKEDPRLGFGRRKSSKMTSRMRSAPSNLSRYIE